MARGFNLQAQLNVKLSQDVKQLARQIQNQLNTVNASVKLNLSPQDVRNLAKMQQVFEATNKTVKETTDSITTFGKQSALAVKRFVAFSVGTASIIGLASAIRSSLRDFIAFDRELIRISQVTGKSVNDLRGLTEELTSLSTSLGVSSKKLASVSVILAQAGLSAQDTKDALSALAKTELSSSFEDIENTAEAAIAVMAQFKVEARELDKVLGSINAVSAKFAVESSDLATVIRRTGGAFKAAGGDLNELLALFTSVRATTRESAESIATGFRTIFTRLQRNRTISFLESFGITLRDLSGDFVGPYKAIERLSVALRNLEGTDPRFAAIIEELGGFRQISKVIPLIKEFGKAQEALVVAQTGQNSLTDDAAKAQQSLAVQISKVREEFDALFRKIGDSAIFRSLINITLRLSSSFIKVAEALTPLLPLITTFAAIKLGTSFKGFFRGFSQDIGGFAKGGVVPGSGNRDTVPAMLTPGEYVIRKKAAEKIGYSQLSHLNKYADGGMARKEADEYSPYRLGDIRRRRRRAMVGGSLTPQAQYYSALRTKRFGRRFGGKDFTMEDFLSEMGEKARYAEGGYTKPSEVLEYIKAYKVKHKIPPGRMALKRVAYISNDQLKSIQQKYKTGFKAAYSPEDLTFYLNPQLKGGITEDIIDHELAHALDYDPSAGTFRSHQKGTLENRIVKSYGKSRRYKNAMSARMADRAASFTAQGATQEQIQEMLGVRAKYYKRPHEILAHANEANSLLKKAYLNKIAQGFADGGSPKKRSGSGFLGNLLSQSDPKTQRRIETWLKIVRSNISEETINKAFSLVPKKSTFLSRGGEALAFKTPTGHVIRVARLNVKSDYGDITERPSIPGLLQSKRSVMIDNKMLVEKLPFVQSFASMIDSKDPASISQAKRGMSKLKRQINSLNKAGGKYFGDPEEAAYEDNAGYYQGSPSIFDPGFLNKKELPGLLKAYPPQVKLKKFAGGGLATPGDPEISKTILRTIGLPENFLQLAAEEQQKLVKEKNIAGLVTSPLPQVRKNSARFLKIFSSMTPASALDPNVAQRVEQLTEGSKKKIIRIREEKEAEKRGQTDRYFGLVGLRPPGVSRLSREVYNQNGQSYRIIVASIKEAAAENIQKNILLPNITRAVTDTSNVLAGELNASLDHNRIQPALKKAGLAQIVGTMFEASLGAVGAPYESKRATNAPIDFPQGLGVAAKLFQEIPGVPSLANIPTDATRTISKAKIAGDEEGGGKSLAKYNKSIGRFLAAERQKLNSGGQVDSVPALLTPGEFVINKKAAARLGASTLHSLNNADKVQRFATGGTVRKFASGGKLPSIGGISAFGGLGLAVLPQLLDTFGSLSKEVESAISSVSQAAFAFSTLKFTLQSVKNFRGSLDDLRGALDQTKTDYKASRAIVKGLTSQHQALFDSEKKIINEARNLAAKGQTLKSQGVNLQQQRAAATNHLQQQSLDNQIKVNQAEKKQIAIDSVNIIRKLDKTKQETKIARDEIDTAKKVTKAKLKEAALQKIALDKAELVSSYLGVFENAILALGAAATIASTSIEKQADAELKLGKSSGVSKLAQAQAIGGFTTGAGIGGAAGAGVGSIIGTIFGGPVGTVIGSQIGSVAGQALGGVLGYYLGDKSGRKAGEERVRQFNFEREFRGLTIALEDVASGRSTARERLPEIQSQISRTIAEYLRSSPDRQETIMGQVQGESTKFENMFSEIAKTSNSFEDFQRTIGFVNLKLYTEFNNIPFGEFRDRISDNIKTLKEQKELTNSINKDNLSFYQLNLRLTKLNQTLDKLNGAYAKSSQAISARNETGGIGDLNIADLFENNMDQVKKAFAENLPDFGEILNKKLTTIQSLKDKLPNVLQETIGANLLEDEETFQSNLRKNISNAIGDMGNAGVEYIETVMTQVRSLVGPNANDIRFIDKFKEDPQGVIDKLLSQFEIVTGAAQKLADNFYKSAQEQDNVYTNIRSFTSSISDLNLEMVNLASEQANVVSSLTDVFKGPIDAFRGNRLNVAQQQSVLGGIGQQNLVNNAAGISAAILESKKRLQSIKTELSDGAGLSFSRSDELLKQRSQEIEKIAALNKALDLQKNAIQGNASIIERINQIQSEQEEKFNLFSGFATGNVTDQVKLLRTVQGADVIANSKRPDFVPEDIRGQSFEILGTLLGEAGRKMQRDIVAQRLLDFSKSGLLPQQFAVKNLEEARQRVGANPTDETNDLLKSINNNFTLSAQATAEQARLADNDRQVWRNQLGELTKIRESVQKTVLGQSITEARTKQQTQFNERAGLLTTSSKLTLDYDIFNQNQLSKVQANLGAISQIRKQRNEVKSLNASVGNLLQFQSGMREVEKLRINANAGYEDIKYSMGQEEAAKNKQKNSLGLLGIDSSQITTSLTETLDNIAPTLYRNFGNDIGDKLIENIIKGAGNQPFSADVLAKLLFDNVNTIIESQRIKQQELISSGARLRDNFRDDPELLKKFLESSDDVFKAQLKFFKSIENFDLSTTQLKIDELSKSIENLGIEISRLEIAKQKQSGGLIYRRRGGYVPGRGNGDIVPARLEPGEFVMNRNAVQEIGLANLTSMNDGARFAAGGRIGFAAGGSPDKEMFERFKRNMNASELAEYEATGLVPYSHDPDVKNDINYINRKKAEYAERKAKLDAYRKAYPNDYAVRHYDEQLKFFQFQKQANQTPVKINEDTSSTKSLYARRSYAERFGKQRNILNSGYRYNDRQQKMRESFTSKRAFYLNKNVAPTIKVDQSVPEGVVFDLPIPKVKPPGMHKVPVFHKQTGGSVGDTVPAMLEPGEFVLNRNAVNRIGVANLSRANSKFSRFQTGGQVGGTGSMVHSIDTASINSLNESINKLSSIFNQMSGLKIPETITLQANHTVEVVINGAQVLQGLTPAIQQMVEQQTMDAINKMLKNKFPTIGSVR